MIIAISGKIGSGKDTVGKIIQYLTYTKNSRISFSSYCLFRERWYNGDDWQIKKFAGKLKQIVSILTGISVEDLEKQEVKDRLLGEDWTRYGYADGFSHVYEDGVCEHRTVMSNKECYKEKYEHELRINWQTAYKVEYTPRILMQYIGTDLFRDKLLNNIHINALFADYNLLDVQSIPTNGSLNNSSYDKLIYPNWAITDMRFPNELEAVEKRNGITIRVERPTLNLNNINSFQHPSETALDNAKFKHTINNDGSIEELIIKVKDILVQEKIL